MQRLGRHGSMSMPTSDAPEGPVRARRAAIGTDITAILADITTQIENHVYGMFSSPRKKPSIQRGAREMEAGPYETTGM
jgi:hypothetical protein